MKTGQHYYDAAFPDGRGAKMPKRCPGCMSMNPYRTNARPTQPSPPLWLVIAFWTFTCGTLVVCLLLLLTGCSGAEFAIGFDADVDASFDVSTNTNDAADVVEADIVDAGTGDEPDALVAIEACPSTQEYYQKFQTELQKDGGWKDCSGKACPTSWCCWARNICVPK